MEPSSSGFMELSGAEMEASVPSPVPGALLTHQSTQKGASPLPAGRRQQPQRNRQFWDIQLVPRRENTTTNIFNNYKQLALFLLCEKAPGLTQERARAPGTQTQGEGWAAQNSPSASQISSYPSSALPGSPVGRARDKRAPLELGSSGTFLVRNADG